MSPLTTLAFVALGRLVAERLAGQFEVGFDRLGDRLGGDPLLPAFCSGADGGHACECLSHAGAGHADSIHRGPGRDPL